MRLNSYPKPVDRKRTPFLRLQQHIFMKKAVIYSILTLFVTYHAIGQNVWEYDAIPNDTKTIVFQDSFDDNRQNWDLKSVLSANQSIEGGNFRFETLSPQHGDVAVRNIYLLQQKNYEIETKVRLEKGDSEDGNGLVWGSAINYEKFTFGIRRDGYSINQNATSVCERIPWMPSELVNIGDYNLLTVRKVNGMCYFFLNQHLVHSMPFNYFLVNNIGFMAAPNSIVSADYLKVAYLPDNPDAALVPPLVTKAPANSALQIVPKNNVPISDGTSNQPTANLVISSKDAAQTAEKPKPAVKPPVKQTATKYAKTETELPPLVSKPTVTKSNVKYSEPSQNINGEKPILRNSDTIPAASRMQLAFNQRKMPTAFGDRNVIVDRGMTVDRNIIRISVWDEEYDDGDTISLFFNGKWILRDYRLQKAVLNLRVALDPTADNYLVMYAHNVGLRPPNTAAVVIYDGVTSRRAILTSDLKNCEAVKLRVREQTP